MNSATIALALLGATSVAASSADLALPLDDGRHRFIVKFAEHPHLTGGYVEAEVRGRHIRITSASNSSVFPTGLVEEGILLWHAASKQWIIGQNEGDAAVSEVGGCSEGPFVVDLEQKVFWTC